MKSVIATYTGAGDRTRTGTLSLAVDFESTTSTNSITPAITRIVYTILIKISSRNCIYITTILKIVLLLTFFLLYC